MANVKDVADLANQHINAQGFLGNAIRIPSEHASDEDRAAFRETLRNRVPELAEVNASDPESVRATMRALGAPEAATGYKMPETPNGMRPVDGFSDWAHEAALTQAQFDTLASRFIERETALSDAAQRQQAAALEGLRSEWGDAYDQRRGQAIGAAKLLDAPQAFVDAMNEDRVDPSWVQFCYGLYSRFGESPDINALGRGEDPIMTPAEAKRQIAEVYANKNHPYHTTPAGDPRRRELNQEMLELTMLAEGKSAREIHTVIGEGAQEEG